MADVLRVGDRSPRVAEARLTLSRLGLLQDYSGPHPKAQGSTEQFMEDETIFDAALSEILKAFQQSRGIIPSGHIDEPTLREMRGATYTLGARVLYLEEDNFLTGDDVSQLQKHLQELGFYTERIDGVFGPATDAALRNFQLNSGLQVDGICGPETVRSLSLLGRRITGGSAQAIREREYVRQSGPSLKGKRVVLDPGLGGANRGMTVKGKFGEITEEEVLWDLADRIAERMRSLGMEVIYSRPRTDDPLPRLRAAMANAAGADIMISLQCDRYQNEKASGIATFYFGSQVGNTSMTGEVLSSYIQREITARMPLVDCGSHARTWDLLRLTRMPTVEIVAGYLTNPHDVAVLTDPKQRDTLADAVVVSLKRLYLLDDDTVATGTFHFAELLEVENKG
ncbi:N-acetylmuramoyl-L-alanine amidase [Corynebacterium caspium]|uniref:N-acetylmuramoyl-L-alanine amidase n=1 Tax=Corynebacterium caspium TaxID=234828 RepID=UPI00037DA738|nr:N-acetylmuramoyl-L-alanine amidase [Corynebacterium caspium]WKD60060.1 Spore cortex-lytic enzyme precursor [Corynebacterium caspium DSM 44850]